MKEPFDPSAYKSYRYHTSMLYIDEKATLSDAKAACPLFFENATKGEKRSMYRGHIIVRKSDTYSDRTSRSRTVIYAFDVRRGDTFCLDVDADSKFLTAKELIDKKLDTPEPNPLNLEFVEIEVTVRAKVKVAVFREQDGGLSQSEVEEWLHVGPPDAIQQKNPGDTFCTVVWSNLAKAVTPA